MAAFRLALFFFLCFFLSERTLAKSFGARLCETSSYYSCYTVQRGDTWQKLFPDETEREIAKRINRQNIALHRGQIIAVPQIYQYDLMAHSPFSQQIDPPGTKIIKVSLTELAFGAYDANGELLHWGPVSGGRNYCADVGRGCRSPAGKFAVYTKRGAGCKSTKFPVGRGGAPMPYCMFFHGGFALHGSPNVPGHNDSHGCIRMFTPDAQWLNEEFLDGEHGVPVIIER